MSKTVALIGVNPDEIDFTNPDYSRFAQIGADGIKEMLEKDQFRLQVLGFQVQLIFLSLDVEVARKAIRSALEAEPWDCILIGNGVRSIPSNFLLFETLVNMIIEFAPKAKICFNTKPDDSVDAVLRWVRP